MLRIPTSLTNQKNQKLDEEQQQQKVSLPYCSIHIQTNIAIKIDISQYGKAAETVVVLDEKTRELQNFLNSLLNLTMKRIEILEREKSSTAAAASFDLEKIDLFLKTMFQKPKLPTVVPFVANLSLDEAYFVLDLVEEEFGIDPETGLIAKGSVSAEKVASFSTQTLKMNQDDWDSILRSDIHDFDAWFKKGTCNVVTDAASREATGDILSEITSKSIVWMNNMETEESLLKEKRKGDQDQKVSGLGWYGIENDDVEYRTYNSIVEDLEIYS